MIAAATVFAVAVLASSPATPQESGDGSRIELVPEALRELMQESMLVDFTEWLSGRCEEQGFRPPRVRHGGRALDLGGVGRVLLWASADRAPELLGMELSSRPSPEPEEAAEPLPEPVMGWARETESGEVVFQTDETELSLPALDALRAELLGRGLQARWHLRCRGPTPIRAVAQVMDAIDARGEGFQQIAHDARGVTDRDRSMLAGIVPSLDPSKLSRIEGEVLLLLSPELPYSDLQLVMQCFAERGFTSLSLAVIGPDGGWGKVPLWIPHDEDLELLEEPPEPPEIEDDGGDHRP